jgi:hypothetical protein
MLTKWTKRWDDGRCEDVELDSSEVDLSQPSMAIQIERVSRTFLREGSVLPSTNFTPPVPWDMGGEFRAFDVVASSESGNLVLSIVYAKESTTAGVYDLCFARYITDSKTLSSSDVVVATNINPAKKACIERLDGTGRLWVAYMDITGSIIYSKTSVDLGVTWSAAETVKSVGASSYGAIEENGFTSTRKGSWVRASGKYFSGGYAYRSAAVGSYIEWTTPTGVSDIFMDTYTSPAKSGNTTYVGKIQVLIDGKVSQTISLNKYSSAYKRRFKLNLAPLSTATTHKVRIKHMSGKYFFLDRIAYNSGGGAVQRLNLNDIAIRHMSGLTANEALVLYGIRDGTAVDKMTTNILANRSGTATSWSNTNATSGTTSYVFKSAYVADSDIAGTFHENLGGLWVIGQTFPYRGGPETIQHYRYEGQTGPTANYAEDQWLLSYSRPKTKTKSQMYSAASPNNGSYTVTSTLYKSVDPAETPTYIEVVPDLTLGGVPVSPQSKLRHVFQVFNLPANTYDDEVGVIGLMDGSTKLMWGKCGFKADSAYINSLSDYTTDLDITHDTSSNPSSLRLNIVSPRSIGGDIPNFIELLPSGFNDRDHRIIRAWVRFNQGGFVYEQPVFTGVLGEVSTKYDDSGEVYSLSAYDYAYLLKKYASPYYYVYANPAPLWGETGASYMLEVVNGKVSHQPLRPKKLIETKNDQGIVTSSVYVGWDLDRSQATGFSVDPVRQMIEQTSSGIALSPEFGPLATGDVGYYCSVDVQFDSDSTAIAEIGVGNAGTWSSGGLYPVSGGIRVCLDSVNDLFYLEDSTASVLAGVSNRYVSGPSKHVSFIDGVTYRVEIYTTSTTVQASIYPKGRVARKTAISSAHKLSVLALSSKAGKKQMYIGYRAGAGTVYYDNVTIFNSTKDKQIVRSDKEVAIDLVSRGTQGFVPVTYSDKNTGDYFPTIVIQPGLSMQEHIDRLSAHNAKLWFFDYDGALVWDYRELRDPDMTLSAGEFQSLDRSYTPTNVINWVEVIDDLAIPAIRVNIADSDSVLRNGVRFTQVTQSQLTTAEQARRIALQKMYESAEGAETVSVSLKQPMTYLKPMSVIRLVDIPSSDPTEVDSMFYTVDKVTFAASKGSLSMSMDLVARYKSLIDIAAEIYNKQGVDPVGN